MNVFVHYYVVARLSWVVAKALSCYYEFANVFWVIAKVVARLWFELVTYYECFVHCYVAVLGIS